MGNCGTETTLNLNVGDVVTYRRGKEYNAPATFRNKGHQFIVKCKRGPNVYLMDGQDDFGDKCPCGRHSWIAYPSEVELQANTVQSVIGTGFAFTNSFTNYYLGAPTPNMSLSNIAKRLLDADTKTLRKANFLDTELNLTHEGKNALWAILFDANKAALVAAAQEVIDEAAKK